MNQQTMILVAASLGLAAVALIVAISAHRRLGVARRALTVLQGTSKARSLLDAISSYGKDLQLFEDALNKIMERQEELTAAMTTTVRNVAVVRYDAFEDMGGRLSFSAALVDDHGTGLVLSAISGRMESRAYAKIVEEGESDMGLSPEERKAIAEAVSGPKRSRTPVRSPVRPKAKARR